jgi:hypothetical protein
MNSRLILAAGATCLFAVAGMVHAQGAPQGAQPSSTQPAMQQNTDAAAQPSADKSSGGVPDTRSAAGSMRSPPCTPKAQCDIFFGN